MKRRCLGYSATPTTTESHLHASGTRDFALTTSLSESRTDEPRESRRTRLLETCLYNLAAAGSNLSRELGILIHSNTSQPNKTRKRTFDNDGSVRVPTFQVVHHFVVRHATASPRHDAVAACLLASVASRVLPGTLGGREVDGTLESSFESVTDFSPTRNAG